MQKLEGDHKYFAIPQRYSLINKQPPAEFIYGYGIFEYIHSSMQMVVELDEIQ